MQPDHWDGFPLEYLAWWEIELLGNQHLKWTGKRPLVGSIYDIFTCTWFGANRQPSILWYHHFFHAVLEFCGSFCQYEAVFSMRKWWAIHSPPFSLQGCHPTSQKDSLFQASKPAQTPSTFGYLYSFAETHNNLNSNPSEVGWKTISFPFFLKMVPNFLENPCPIAKMFMEKKTRWNIVAGQPPSKIGV